MQEVGAHAIKLLEWHVMGYCVISVVDLKLFQDVMAVQPLEFIFTEI